MWLSGSIPSDLASSVYVHWHWYNSQSVRHSIDLLKLLHTHNVSSYGITIFKSVAIVYCVTRSASTMMLCQ